MIIPGFYLGFAGGYYFQGRARFKRLLVTGRVACKQMMPKDERRSIGEGKKEGEGRI